MSGPVKLRTLAIVVEILCIGGALSLHTDPANLYSRKLVQAWQKSGQPATICIRDEEAIASWNKIKPDRVLVLEGNTQQCT
jgi:hypothetical protein